MSKPNRNNAQHELVSAQSALNTETTYTGPSMKDDEFVFISHAEPMAKHSIEHMSAAMKIMDEVRVKDISNVRRVVELIVRDLGGWDKLPFNRWDEFDESLRVIERKL